MLLTVNPPETAYYEIWKLVAAIRVNCRFTALVLLKNRNPDTSALYHAAYQISCTSFVEGYESRPPDGRLVVEEKDDA